MEPSSNNNTGIWIGRILSGLIVTGAIVLGLVVRPSHEPSIREPTIPRSSRTSSESRRRSKARSSV